MNNNAEALARLARIQRLKAGVFMQLGNRSAAIENALTSAETFAQARAQHYADNYTTSIKEKNR